jgi:hypothetical protein
VPHLWRNGLQARPRKRLFWLCLPLALAIAISAVAGVWEVSAPAAYAQEKVRPWSLRDLFLPRRARREDPPPAARPARPRVKAKKPTVRRKAEPQIVIAPKAPDAKAVLVVGDFIGKSLAEGLNAVFADNPKVRIIDKTSAASGFVREDHFDWPGQIGEIVAAEKPSVVIVQIGANDRQTMRIGKVREALRSEPWLREYSARAVGFAAEAAASETPLVWVGTVPFRSPKTSTDMLALNEIYRKVSTDVGAEFIDVWEGFVDEAGSFVTTGPDVNGQPVKLRTGDGFTTAGKRKLAFYTEKPLKRLLGDITDPNLAPSLGAPVAAVPGVIIPSDRTQPMALSDPALDGGAELLGASVNIVPASATPVLNGPASDPLGPATRQEGTDSKPEEKENSPKSVAGRADDFSWPPRQREPAKTDLKPDNSPTASTTNGLRPGN